MAITPLYAGPVGDPNNSTGAEIAATINELIAITEGVSTNLFFNKATLDYDFGKAVYKEYKNKYITEIPLVDAVTCSRNSSGTADHPFGVVSYDANEPRVQYNSETSERLGLLGEEPRTNKLLQSEDFLNAAWTQSPLADVDVSSNVTMAPDGRLTADKFYEATTANTFHDIFQSSGTTFTAGTAETLSIFVKAAERSRGALVFSSGSAFTTERGVAFDLTTGTVAPFGTGATATIKKYPNGWFRISVTATPDATAISNVYLRLRNNSNASIYAGVVGSGLFVWGAQLEVGNSLSSYIPTTTASMTRLGALQTINSLPAMAAVSPEYTIYLQFTATDDRCLFGMASTTTGFNNTVYFAEKTVYVRTNNILITSSMTFNYTYGTKVKLAFRIKAGDYALAGNGTITGASNAAGAPPTDLGRATIFNAPWESAPSLVDSAIGVMERIVFIPRALTNAELQALTS